MKLSFIHLGNGITVYSTDILDESTNDYPTLAHIDRERVISYRQIGISKLSKADKKEIEHFAATANPNISATQTEKVFTTYV